MTFSRVHALPGWATNEKLTSPQANLIDLNLSRAVDGYGGGAYSPLSAITINGSFGLTLNAPTAVNAAMNFNSGASASFFSGSTLLISSGSISLIGSSTVTSGGATTWTFNGAVTYSSTLTLASGSQEVVQSGGLVKWQSGSELRTDSGAAVNFNSNVTCNGTLTTMFTLFCQGSIWLYGTNYLLAGAKLVNSGVIENTGVGRVRQRVIDLTLPSTSLTYTADYADIVRFNSLAGNTIVVLSPTGATTGDMITLTASHGMSGGFNITVKDNVGNILNQNSVPITTYHGATFCYSAAAGSWQCVSQW